MYCRGCSYELRGLAAQACPECGRRFDPGDKSTFAECVDAGKRGRWLEWGLVGVGSSTLLANVCVHLTLVAARFSLGRWPHRGGADDPKGINGIDFLYALTGIVGQTALFAVIPAAMLAIGLTWRGAWFRLARGLVVSLILWLGGFAMIWWDPAQAWGWYFD